MVSTLEAKNRREPGPVGYPVEKPTTQKRERQRPRVRSAASRSVADRAPASLGTESPVVEALRGALYDPALCGGSVELCDLAGRHPDTLVVPVSGRLTDPGSIPGSSTNEGTLYRLVYRHLARRANRLAVIAELDRKRKVH